MKLFVILGLITLVICTTGCIELPGSEYVEVDFELLYGSYAPLCIETSELVVINSPEDFRNLRKMHSHQGPYENFVGDGQTKVFKLSYQPLDRNNDGVLGIEDFVVEYNGEYYQYEKADGVVKIDPVTGEIEFFTAPGIGEELYICGYTDLSHEGKSGSRCARLDALDSFDFSNKTILGQRAGGGGCHCDIFEKKVVRSDNEKKVKYVINILDSGLCSMGCTNYNLITVSKIPKDYEISSEIKQNNFFSWS